MYNKNNFHQKMTWIILKSFYDSQTKEKENCLNNIKGFLFSQRLLNGISEANDVYFWLGMAESINGRQGD